MISRRIYLNQDDSARSILLDDINIAEFVPPSVPGQLEWAGILVLP